MATIIKPAAVREGDKIRVTIQDGDRESSHTGVANHFKRVNGGISWKTAEDWTLWTSDDTAVIELLDRPKPKLTVPTLPNAVVKYTFDNWSPESRFAVRDYSGRWVCYDAEGGQRNTSNSDEAFQALLLSDSPEFEVLFEGVSK